MRALGGSSAGPAPKGQSSSVSGQTARGLGPSTATCVRSPMLPLESSVLRLVSDVAVLLWACGLSVAVAGLPARASAERAPTNLGSVACRDSSSSRKEAFIGSSAGGVSIGQTWEVMPAYAPGNQVSGKSSALSCVELQGLVLATNLLVRPWGTTIPTWPPRGVLACQGVFQPETKVSCFYLLLEFDTRRYFASCFCDLLIFEVNLPASPSAPQEHRLGW